MQETGTNLKNQYSFQDKQKLEFQFVCCNKTDLKNSWANFHAGPIHVTLSTEAQWLIDLF